MEREKIEKRLRKLEEEIEEVLKRIPAHSAKPPMIQELLELEDERDLLLEKLARDRTI